MKRAKYISNGTITYKITGDPGPQGPEGPKGDTGKSAYQIAVDNGYNGTESEWLATLKPNLIDIENGSFFGKYAIGNMIGLATDWLTDQYYYVSNLNVIYSSNSDGYTGFILKVKPDTDYSCTFARFILRMSDKTNVIDKLENLTTFNSGDAEYIAISFNTSLYPKESFCINIGTKLDDSELKYNPTWLYHPNTINSKIYNGTMESKKQSMSDGNIIECDEIHTKKNKIIMFKCDITNLSDIEIGHGRNIYPGSSIEIFADTYTVYKYTPTKTEVISGEHGLTLSDFLTVTIIANDDLKAKIIIGTKNGTNVIDNIYWDGAVGKPFALIRSGYTTNNVLKYKCIDFKKDIFAFGDSYITLGTNERWVYYVKELGFNNWILDGFGGRNSIQAIVSFRNMMKIAKPKYVLWILGMNDADTETSINTNWKNCVDEVVLYCKDNDITPILATIPCTPTQRNELKNEYVKSLGYRYIDFAKAVNGEHYGDTWYSGYLASDNIHPLALGAEALAHQAFIDVPELLN